MKDKGILLDPATNDLQVDILRDASGKITAGLLSGDATQQNAALIISMEAGEIKTSPTVGVGISAITNDHDTLWAKHRIRVQLEADGQKVSYLKITTSIDNKMEIAIHANY